MIIMTVYLPGEKSADVAEEYVKTKASGARYLAFRDVGSLFEKYVPNNRKALDYGAGTGLSAQFLQSHNCEVVGVDISQEMLQIAKNQCPDIEFLLIENNTIPAEPQSFDLVFSSLVLFEIATEEGIVSYLKEAKRVLKEDGIFIAVTGSEHALTRTNWTDIKTDFPENKNIISGGLGKVYLYEIGIEFNDYHWTEADYRALFPRAGLQIVEFHYPLGQQDDGFAWKDELTISPWVVIVAKPI